MKHPRSIYLLPLLLSITVAAHPQITGSTVKAASCNQRDVNAVINGPTHHAVDGDTIEIPAGTCTWTSGIAIPRGIGISIIGAGTPNNTPDTTGAGASSTVIVDDIASGASPKQVFLAYPIYGNAALRISTMTIEPADRANPYSPIGVFGTCTSAGCPNVRIDNITFPSTWAGTHGLQDAALILANNMFGVLDHNTVTGNDGASYLGFANFSDGNWMGVGDYGDNSWASPDTFGTAQAIYMENNQFNNNIMAVDCDTSDTFEDAGGCRYVARFNTYYDPSSVGAFVNHGTETGGRMRGARQMEVYDNSVTCVSRSGCDAISGARSGVLYTFDNSVTVDPGSFINYFMYLSDYRTFAGFDPWGYCDGQGLWDSNDGTVYASGTIGGGSISGGVLTILKGILTITDLSKNWAVNQWVDQGAPYSIVDTSVNVTNGGWTGHPGFEITGNTSNSISTSNYGNDYWDGPPHFNVGDHYQILRATYCIDQPSRSGGTLLSGATPSPAGWVNETLDPSYEWGDTVTGSKLNHTPVGSDTARLIDNRDYYMEVSQSAQTSPTSPFNGTVGTGFGTLANRPTSCTVGVAYWATDQGDWNKSGIGGQGELFKCTAPNTWSLAYTPYTYPHPLIAGNGATAPTGPNAPGGLTGTLH